MASVQISRDAILSQRVLSKEQVRPPAGLPRFSRDFTTRKIGRAHRPPTGLCLVKKLEGEVKNMQEQKPLEENMSFEAFGLRPEILRAVAEKKYTTPTPIQEKAIPIVL